MVAKRTIKDNKEMRNFREYPIWLQGRELVKEVYLLTKQFPASEVYALSNQLQRAVVSIPSNIAEGAGRASNADFAHFLEIALGSTYEVETQICVAMDLGYCSTEQQSALIVKIQRLEKEMLNFIRTLKEK